MRLHEIFNTNPPRSKRRREGNASFCLSYPIILANGIKKALVYNQNFTGRVTFVTHAQLYKTDPQTSTVLRQVQSTPDNSNPR